MDLSELVHIAANYGSSGIIVAWFAWRDMRRDAREEKERARREALEEKRIAADLALASGYAVLATKLDNLTHVRGD